MRAEDNRLAPDRPLHLVALGEGMVEFSPAGEISTSRLFERSFGGDTLNCLVTAARLGSPTGYITRVGDDLFGYYLLESWEKEGIDLSHIQLARGFNGLYFIIPGPHGARDFLYYRQGSAASRLSPEDLDPGYLASAAVFFASGITQALSASCRQAVKEGFSLAREAGCVTAYDPNYRSRLWSRKEAREALEEVAGLVEVALPSWPEESRQLLGLEDPIQVIEFFWQKGAKVVTVKKGSQGACVGFSGKIKNLPPYPGPVVDTTGAGDAFNGAFLHGLVQGLDPFVSGLLANAVASLSIRGQGAVKLLPLKEVAYQIFEELLSKWDDEDPRY